MSDELYLEKLKIAERLQAVESTLITHTTKMDAWMEKTQKLLDKHSEEIWGNGHPGLKTTVDRLNQLEDGRRWWLRGFGISVVGLLAKEIWSIFTKHP